MSNYDPRVLIRILNILEEEFQRFTQTSSDTLEESEYTQRCAQERINQALRWSAIISNQVQSDLETIREVETEVNRLLSQCIAAVDTAHETIVAVGEIEAKAEATLNNWKGELLRALEWQSRAEARLKMATQVYEQARMRLSSANNALRNAEISLNQCRSNPERKNCNSEQMACNNAQSAVRVAQEEVYKAEREVNDAERELERATS